MDTFSSTPYDLSANSIAAIDNAEANGKIDATSNLADRSIYIYSGLQDDITVPAGQQALNSKY